MADILGLYYKTGGIESGGTNALTGLVAGGTLISRDDAESAPAVLAEQGVVYTLYYRAIDDSTLDDAGKDTAEAVTISAPYDCKVCNVYNGYFGNSVDLPSATGSYQPVYIKRTGVSAATPNLEVGSGGVTFEAGTRLSAPSGLAITLSASGAALDWSDLASADYYEVQRATDSGFTTGVSIVASGLAASEYTDSSLGDYYYRVRGTDENGAGAWCSGVLSTPYWSDDFGDASIDTALIGSDLGTNCTITETGGQLVLDAFTSADVTERTLVYFKKPVYRLCNGVFKTTMVSTGSKANGYIRGIKLYNMMPTDRTASISSYLIVTFEFGNTETTGGTAHMSYYDSSGVRQYWTGSAWTTTATNLPASTGQHVYELGDVFEQRVEFNGTQMRLVAKHVGNNYTTTSDWVNLSGVRTGDTWYAATGDNSTSARYMIKLNDISYAAS